MTDIIKETQELEQIQQNGFNESGVQQALRLMKKLDVKLTLKRNQNYKHRNELLNLNKIVDQELNKLKIKQKYNPEDNLDFYQKEIQNAQKAIEYNEKILKNLQERETKALNPNKILDLENENDKKQEEIQALQIEIKDFDRKVQAQSKQIENIQEEAQNHKMMNILSEELKCLREREKEIQKKQLMMESNLKKQQEYITKQEEQFKLQCQKLGKSPSDFLPQPKKEEEKTDTLQQISKKFDSVKDYLNYDKDLAKTGDLEIDSHKNLSDTQIKLMKDKLKACLITKDKLQRRIKQETDGLKQLIKQCEEDIQEINKNIEQRIQESQQSNTQFTDYKNLVKNYALTPILDDKKQNFSKKEQDVSQKVILKACLKSKFRPTKREANGGVFSSNVVCFDDADFLNNSISHRIKKIDFFYDGRTEIYGFKAYYVTYKQNIEWEEVEGFSNIDSGAIDSCQKLTLEINQGDFIRQISGYCSEVIDYLKIETEKGTHFTIGMIPNPKSKPREFSIDIGLYQQPITLFGGLDYKLKNDSSSFRNLAYIGVELKNPLLPLKNNKSKMILEEEVKPPEINYLKIDTSNIDESQIPSKFLFRTRVNRYEKFALQPQRQDYQKRDLSSKKINQVDAQN